MGWNSSTSIGFVFILAFLSIFKTAGFWNSSTSIVLVLILAFLSILKTAGFWNNDRRQNFPPGPRPLPIIGNLLLFDLKRPYRTYLQVLIFFSVGPINQAPQSKMSETFSYCIQCIASMHEPLARDPEMVI